MSGQEFGNSRENIEFLVSLYQNLNQIHSFSDKLSYVSLLPRVKELWSVYPKIYERVIGFPVSDQYLLNTIIAIGQGGSLLSGISQSDEPEEKLKVLIQYLSELEKFYDSIGGIIGYQLKVLNLIEIQKKTSSHPSCDQHFIKAEGLNVSKKSKEVRKAIRNGIESLNSIAMVYPLGGAADRLHLQDPDTGEQLPAAQLRFCGHTLLEGLIRDLQGWEYLYYKLFGKQLHTPIAIMTSQEKCNHERILQQYEQKGWFGRRTVDFRFFTQPLVPMMTAEGEWLMSEPGQLMLKPGGHGALWKAALDSGSIDWIEKQQRQNVIVRQINNPMAAVDDGLFALAGVGTSQNKDFGFASCPRLLRMAEGMDVLKERVCEKGQQFEYCISNVEYTDFTQHGIDDVPETPGSCYSKFPSNTNILFARLSAIKSALELCPLPGMIVNLKNRVLCWQEGQRVEKLAGRLESTMQNIADYIVDRVNHKLSDSEHHTLLTFLNYNERRKTISVVKKVHVAGEPLIGTPEGCFYEAMENYRELLTSYCGMMLPPTLSESDYLSYGPNFTAAFHPALGPLWSVMAQKIRKGKIAEGSEYVIEASEVDIEELDLSGCLIIEADAVMGKRDASGFLIYNAEQSGKCILQGVKVRNKGRCRRSWRDDWQKDGGEKLYIKLEGNGEFVAKDVELLGNQIFVIPNGQRLVVYKENDEVKQRYEKIDTMTSFWKYTFDSFDCLAISNVIEKLGI